MKIAELGPLWKPVPPPKYGGSELIASLVTENLQKLGQNVTLFAAKGAKTKTKLVETLPKPLYSLVGGFQWKYTEPFLLEGIARAFQFIKSKNFDIVHNHIGFEALPFSSLTTAPIVTTIHSSLPPDSPVLAHALRRHYFVSISNAQRKSTPYLNYVATVYHGIDTSAFKPNTGQPEDYFVFLGTLSPEKGADFAVKIAQKAKIRLLIAGEIRSQEFFKKSIKPYLGEKIKFLGELTHKQKNELLRNAKALLFPITWNEAFGLVMVESLASGTPVIAFKKGSVPEILDDAKTGFVVTSKPSFASAIKNVAKISRSRCRRVAEQRFDAKIMAQNYLKVFNHILNLHRK